MSNKKYALLSIAVITIATYIFFYSDIQKTAPPKDDDPKIPHLENISTPLPLRKQSSLDTYKGLHLQFVDNGRPQLEKRAVIGMACIGMSNAHQECEALIRLMRSDRNAAFNPLLKIVNCAVGSHAIERWNDPRYDSVLWDACIQKISGAGMHPRDIQIIWHKAAIQFPMRDDGTMRPDYPHPDSHYFYFQDQLDAFAQRLREKMPGVKAVFNSSRSYGGFAIRSQRGEPISYESGHALNQWLMKNNIVNGVWYGWGPYLWGPDCSSDQAVSGELCYNRDDFQTDGIHPSNMGEVKIAKIINAFFMHYGWYRK